MDLLKEITFDDLEPEQRELAELIGLEAYKRLISVYAGSYVYVCKSETITAKIRNRKICMEFNGYNFRELARKYNLSERQIRNITSEELARLKNKPPENQISFFE